MNYKLASINVGKTKMLEFKDTLVDSGIYKEPIQQEACLTYTQLEGDEQADLKHHGGHDKALCAYSYDHKSYWEQTLGITITPAFFGENLTLIGLTEKKACIGDIYQFGEAMIQVSQPRQPCYKLAAISGIENLAEQVQKTGYTGFYFRVIKEGKVSPDSDLKRLENNPNQVSVDFINKLFYGDEPDIQKLQKLLELGPLAASWKKDIQKRIKTHEKRI